MIENNNNYDDMSKKKNPKVLKIENYLLFDKQR